MARFAEMSDVGSSFIDKIAARAQSAAASLRVRSALNPMLWLCAIVSVPCFGLAFYAGPASPMMMMFAIIGSAPVVATILGFLYFMVHRPDKLQSEEYQIRHETLELIRQKGSSIAINPSSLEAIANPVIRSIGGPEQP